MTAEQPSVTWRDGVHLTKTSIWCDAPRRRDLCFVSAAGVFGQSRHGQLLGTRETIGLVRTQRAAPLADSELAVPLARPFSLGGLRLELFASGHALGAAALRVEAAGSTMVYARAINPQGAPLAGPADVRRADILVLSGRYTDKSHAFSTWPEGIAELAGIIETTHRGGGSVVLIVSSSTKALAVAAGLARSSPCFGHPRFAKFSRCARQLGFASVHISRAPNRIRPGSVVLWPMGVPLPGERLPPKSVSVLVSGQAVDPDAIHKAGATRGLALSDHADYQATLQFIADTGAREVFFVGELSTAMSDALAQRDVRSHAIGPPTQLRLGL